ncbi:MAG: 2-amino-4-hydroxy-6-hydroxymethyldihydropteridine diphosphokinase [Bacteroidales bacterium]|jgi:2-amino-4-hydroxy-6-hydroxymethyldihydropteridine diphosphokinase|nr:2-amino-4-hydroxy-6-hydroxymethyldihydropteridine diphosphokinase [Bacteroidales bacterium]
MKNTAILLLGANLGNEELLFAQVRTLCSQRIGTITAQSKLYTSKAWGFEHENLFYNQALVVLTSKTANETLAECLAIETELGRTRSQNNSYEARIIDIDIEYFNSDIINTSTLHVPHPLVHLREFALIPLCEIAPDFVHPILGKTQRELLLELANED